MSEPTFEPMLKIPRLRRECVITEKIDGTNAQIYITPETSEPDMLPDIPWVAALGNVRIAAGSRNRWITPESDNYGFARWVRDNAEQLIHLGPGRHFGEWWGLGIQRGYGMSEKRFSLFNVARWKRRDSTIDITIGKEFPPECCHVVPVLSTGIFSTGFCASTLKVLDAYGSVANPGFPRPEGIVIYHTASKQLFKQTIENDDSPKSA